MAFMNQEKKKELAPGIKAVLKKYGMKGSISVRHHSTLIVKIKSGKLDIIENSIENTDVDNNPFYSPEDMQQIVERKRKEGFIGVNYFHIDTHYSGEVAEFLKELKSAMMKGNHDNSDIMTDYHDVGWYIEIEVGSYNKPYQLLEVA